jgi:hypothetical protein
MTLESGVIFTVILTLDKDIGAAFIAEPYHFRIQVHLKIIVLVSTLLVHACQS